MAAQESEHRAGCKMDGGQILSQAGGLCSRVVSLPLPKDAIIAFPFPTVAVKGNGTTQGIKWFGPHSLVVSPRTPARIRRQVVSKID